ncbi:hypothetical protein TNCV_3214411 [Trichonephila clavipes]|nr:hypothetical protein TNCV_3214411 [Trichonephila clavipes]
MICKLLTCQRIQSKTGTGIDTYNVPTMFLNGDIVQEASHTKLHLDVVACIAAHIGRDSTTVSRIWNIDALRTVKQNDVLDLNGALSLAADKKVMLPA